MPMLPEPESQLMPFLPEFFADTHASAILRKALIVNPEALEKEAKPLLKALSKSELKHGGIEVSHDMHDIFVELDQSLLHIENTAWKKLPLSDWLASFADEKIPGRAILFDAMKSGYDFGDMNSFIKNAPSNAKKPRYLTMLEPNFDVEEEYRRYNELHGESRADSHNVDSAMRTLFIFDALWNSSLSTPYKIARNIEAHYDALSPDEQTTFDQFKKRVEHAAIGFENSRFKGIAQNVEHLTGWEIPQHLKKAPHPSRLQQAYAEAKNFIRGSSPATQPDETLAETKTEQAPANKADSETPHPKDSEFRVTQEPKSESLEQDENPNHDWRNKISQESRNANRER
jgi:hypothetical protein